METSSTALFLINHAFDDKITKESHEAFKLIQYNAGEDCYQIDYKSEKSFFTTWQLIIKTSACTAGIIINDDSVWAPHVYAFVVIVYPILLVFILMSKRLVTEKSKRQVNMALQDYIRKVLNNNFDCLSGVLLKLWDPNIKASGASFPTAMLVDIFGVLYTCSHESADASERPAFYKVFLHCMRYIYTTTVSKAHYDTVDLHITGNMNVTEGVDEKGDNTNKFLLEKVTIDTNKTSAFWVKQEEYITALLPMLPEESHAEIMKRMKQVTQNILDGKEYKGQYRKLKPKYPFECVQKLYKNMYPKINVINYDKAVPGNFARLGREKKLEKELEKWRCNSCNCIVYCQPGTVAGLNTHTNRSSCRGNRNKGFEGESLKRCYTMEESDEQKRDDATDFNIQQTPSNDSGESICSITGLMQSAISVIQGAINDETILDGKKVDEKVNEVDAMEEEMGMAAAADAQLPPTVNQLYMPHMMTAALQSAINVIHDVFEEETIPHVPPTVNPFDMPPTKKCR